MKYVYIDMLFFINFFIDASLLIFTAIYCTRKIDKIRLFFATLLGAVYSISWVLYMNAFIFSIIGKLFVSFLLVRIAFPWKNLRVYAQTVVTFYIINFITAGVILTLQLLLLSNKQLYNQWVTVGEKNIWIIEATATSIGIGIPIAYLAVKNMWLYIKELSWEKSCIYKCKIIFKGKVVCFNGLIDTGNQLIDHITKKPVSIVELEIMKTILPSFVNSMYDKGSLELVDMLEIIHNNSVSDIFTVVPYRAIGSANSYLLAFKTEFLIIEAKEGDINHENSLIAITNQGLSRTQKFSGIIHPQLLDEVICEREDMLHDCNSKENSNIT